MNKKSVAASFLVVFMAIFFSVIGICFSSFVFVKTKIVVQAVGVVADGGIEVYGDKDLTKKVNELKLSTLDTGLKPATGELDDEFKIPSTITDEGTTEGYYSKVFVKTSEDFKIVIKNIKIESKKDKLAVKEERENIYIALKDVKDANKNLKDDNVELASFSKNNETKELTFLIWLDALAGDDLEGAKISFDVVFELI